MENDPPLSPMATLRWSVVRPILEDLAPRDVFEVGCGQGSVGARIARMAHYVGVEPDARSWKVAHDRINPNGGVVLHGLADRVPGRHQFDVVCAFEVLEHIEDDVASLADWLTRLRRGGSVVVSVPAWPDRFTAMDARVGHYRRYTPAGIARVLHDAGCVEVRTVLYGWPLGYALEAVRARIAARPGAAREEDMAARSAASGRLFQPRRTLGTAVRLGVAPFAMMQKARSTRGTGLIAVGMRPRD